MITNNAHFDFSPTPEKQGCRDHHFNSHSQIYLAVPWSPQKSLNAAAMLLMMMIVDL